MLLFRDLIRLFACYNDGIINLLEKYFDMNKKQCKDALDLYKKFLVRMDRVAEFLKVAEVCCVFARAALFLLQTQYLTIFRMLASIRVTFPIWQKHPAPCWRRSKDTWPRLRDAKDQRPIRQRNRPGQFVFYSLHISQSFGSVIYLFLQVIGVRHFSFFFLKFNRSLSKISFIMRNEYFSINLFNLFTT